MDGIFCVCRKKGPTLQDTILGRFTATSTRSTLISRRKSSVPQLRRGVGRGLDALLLDHLGRERLRPLAAEHRGDLLVRAGRQLALGGRHGGALLAGQLGRYRVALP